MDSEIEYVRRKSPLKRTKTGGKVVFRDWSAGFWPVEACHRGWLGGGATAAKLVSTTRSSVGGGEAAIMQVPF